MGPFLFLRTSTLTTLTTLLLPSFLCLFHTPGVTSSLLLLPSVSLARYFSRPSRLHHAIVFYFNFNGTFPITTTTPVLSLHSAGSSHTTYVPRASELVATAGRSLDYAPSLFHHHPTTVLAYSLSRPSPSYPHRHPLAISSHPRSPRRSHYRSPTHRPFRSSLSHRTGARSLLADNYGHRLNIVISLATI